MRPLRESLGAFAVLAGLSALSAPAAQAQDIDTFKPSGSHYAGWGSLQLQHPEIGLKGGYYGGVGLVYAQNPLVYLDEEDVETIIVRNQFSTRLAAGYNIAGRVRADLEFPLYPAVGLGETEPTQFALGDLRLAATVPLLRYDANAEGASGVGVALVPYVHLPTGDPALFTSSGAFGGGLTASVGGRAGPVGWTTNAGVDFAQATLIGDAADQGTSFDVGAGIHYYLNPEYLVGAEVDGALTIDGDTYEYNESPGELHGYISWGEQSGPFATFGAGTGIVAGIGAPDYRVFAILGWREAGAPSDPDRDGIIGNDERCPYDPVDVDNFEDTDGCPDTDNDRDGILDVDDTCPDEPEDFDKWEDRDGCPDPDNDADLVLDVDDACPIEPGLVELQGCPDDDDDGIANPKDECPLDPGPVCTNGCPDRDGDCVADKRDKCPDEHANPDNDPRFDPRYSNGCPSLAFRGKDRIYILDKIYFDLDKASIKSESFPVLDAVVKVLEENPDVLLVEIAGHTDQQGPDDYNQGLSDRRTASVRQYLIDKGVGGDRLISKGYGESQLVDEAENEEAYAKNRRVEFHILQQEGVAPDEDAPEGDDSKGAE